MTQMSRVSKNNTKITHCNNRTELWLHNNCILTKYLDRRVKLNSCGWRSATTKTRINQFANQYCEGAFHVYQKDFQWFVDIHWTCLEPIPFVDGMEFDI